MVQHIWNHKDTEQLKLLEGTMTLNQIAEQLGRTKDSIRHKIKWLKGQRPGPEPIKVEQAKPKPIQRFIPPKEISAEPIKRESRAKGNISYPALEWCENCNSPVSNWSDHIARMRHMGCKRPSYGVQS